MRPPPSRPRSASSSAVVAATASALLALAAGVGACGSGAQCAIDSDCPLGQRCNTANQCVPRGGGDLDAAVEPRDAGPRTDGGPTSDTGPSADAARDASASGDSGAPPDADLDANADAFDACPALAPAYTVSRVGIGCMSGASMVSFVRRDGACAYDVSSDVRGDVEGTVTLDMGELRGGLNFPDLGRICTVAVFPTAAAITCSGGCSIELTAVAP